jgi:hypothetical protein
MLAGAERIEPEQFSWQMKANHLLVAIAIQRDGLECAFAGDIQGAQRLASMEQRFATLQWPPVQDDAVEAFDAFDANAGWQAQHLQRTLRATAPEFRDIQSGIGIHVTGLKSLTAAHAFDPAIQQEHD